MTADPDYTVAIIGGGPAGYSAALRCAEHGLKTALIEERFVGGVCLNAGCIPSKALIHAADTYHRSGAANDLAAMGISLGTRTLDLATTMEWKSAIVARLRTSVESLLARGKIDLVQGRAEVIDPYTVRVGSHETSSVVTTRSLVLATGSRPIELPQVPFGGRVMSSTEALALERVPETLIVIGGGYIGLELGTAFRKFGASVTIVEAGSRILPSFDAQLTRPVVRRTEEIGIRLLTDSRVESLDDSGLVVRRNETREVLACDVALVTVGRHAAVEGLGLERLGLELIEGAVAIDRRCRTSVRDVYAIGDVSGDPMLAHRAMAQGELLGDELAGVGHDWDVRAVPAVCFTDPEICSVGLSPDQAIAEGVGEPIVVGHCELRSNGRALTLHQPSGFVRVVAGATSGRLLGVQAVGAQVAELAAAVAIAIELETTLDDLIATVIAHPTLSEGLANAISDARARQLRPSPSVAVEN